MLESKQVLELPPNSQVLIIGLSARPQACVRADQLALDQFFELQIYLPLPTYASCCVSFIMDL